MMRGRPPTARAGAGGRRATRSAGRAPRPARPPRLPPRSAASRRPKAFPDEALHPRDRGPVRAYVRDLVDSRRRGLVGLFVPGFGGTLIAALGPASNLQRWLLVICAALLAVSLVDAVVLGRTATRRARARFPGEIGRRVAHRLLRLHAGAPDAQPAPPPAPGGAGRSRPLR